MDINRKTAYATLMDVETKKSYSNLALNHQIKINRPDSQGIVRERVYGLLENKLLLDHYIDQLTSSGAEKIKPSDRTVLRMGIYQLAFMDSVPEYAAVNESVVLAKRYCRGREAFINGVLRSYTRERFTLNLPDRSEDEVKYLSVKYSYAPWIVELWLDQYSVDFVEELLAAGNETPEVAIRVNWLKAMKKDVIQKLRDRNFIVREGQLCENTLYVKGEELLDTIMYQQGFFSVQDESSLYATVLLDPKKGDTVIDTCAAPGGKSLAIAERMNNKGVIYATDIYKRKLDIINREAERLGIKNIRTYSWDATRVDSDMYGRADKVIVDAPCSGLGVVRHKPEIKYKNRSREMDHLPTKQLAILSAASKYVKAGGTLLYCTCTINKDENEKVVNGFLRHNKAFTREEKVQLFPHINGTDGFFICKMKKADNMIGR
ncbi:MAG: 16S rRNA (cytosine(967)-C(5))-methyltransferase RsmB [Firmicutes bacterium]|nr:16S rRNA (cytosine(967)-C(5))-methyltransferase RsmB [Bacillota bacterium]